MTKDGRNDEKIKKMRMRVLTSKAPAAGVASVENDGRDDEDGDEDDDDDSDTAAADSAG